MARGIFDQVSILCSCRRTGNLAEFTLTLDYVGNTSAGY